MRHLRLLGPARVDQIQKAQKKAVESEAQESAAGGAPRFRQHRCVFFLNAGWRSPGQPPELLQNTLATTEQSW